MCKIKRFDNSVHWKIVKYNDAYFESFVSYVMGGGGVIELYHFGTGWASYTEQRS